MKLIKDLGMIKIDTAKLKVRFGLYQCPFCKNTFKARTANIKSKNTKSCGCRQYPEFNKLRLTGIYRSWDHMKQRCLNEKNDNFHHYGGRGIKICNDWLQFDNFSSWSLLNDWEEGLSIDRINPNGNYEPTNCRWTNMTIQNRNTRNLQKNNTSGYRGVTKIQLSNSIKYKAEIMVDYTIFRIGRFDTAIKAAKAYNNFVIKNNLEHTINNVV